MLSVTVLHYNDIRLTEECLESIELQIIPVNHELILVDNGSDKPFPERSGWKVFRIPKNAGNIGGQNACFAAASQPTVLFVSNDVRFMPGSIKNMLKYHEENAQSMPAIYRSDASIDSFGLNYAWPGYGYNSKDIRRRDAIPSIVYMMNKDVFRFIGGFDKEFISSHEDLDMGFRLTKWRFELQIIPSARVVHLGNQTLGKLPYYNRQLIRTARKKLIRKHYTGINRATRIAAVSIMDFIRGGLFGRNSSSGR